jgi:sulfur-oxidizing protein SoxX
MKMSKFLMIPLGILPLLALSSCKDEAAKMGKGFQLPEGNIEHGQSAFVALKCHQCHTIAGVELPKLEPSPVFSLELEGEVRKVKSYGELVTAIIQPQHIISPDYLAKIDATEREGTISPMPSMNDQMTVTQMTNIVTFLHSHYVKVPTPGVNYPNYAP